MAEVADLNRDGVKEIYLGGVSNAYAQATLVVLDPRDFAGGSVEERSEYQFLHLPPGKEMARILFPKGCIARKFNTLYNTVLAVRTLPDGLLFAEVAERPNSPTECVHYRFGPDLRLHSTMLTDSLRWSHADFYARAQLDHALSAQEEAAFGEIRFVPPAGIVPGTPPR